MMLRRAAAWALTVLIGVALGALSLWATLEIGAAGFGAHYGLWSHNRAAGSAAAGPYTRAIIAREGLLALSAREALYFNLDSDADGRPLDESCVYELRGAPMAARWWSVTLYGDDAFLIDNGDNAYSVDASDIGAGPWSIRIAPVQGSAPYWLSSRSAGRGFALTLRVYNPQDSFRASGDTLPTLSRISCAEER